MKDYIINIEMCNETDLVFGLDEGEEHDNLEFHMKGNNSDAVEEFCSILEQLIREETHKICSVYATSDMEEDDL